MSTWSEIYTIKFPTSSSSPAISTITPSRPASLLRIIVVALATGPSGHTAFTLDALVPSTATLQQNGTVVPRADFANGWANLPGTSREFYGVQEGGVTCVVRVFVHIARFPQLTRCRAELPVSRPGSPVREPM